jgi:hypothetical protein
VGRGADLLRPQLLLLALLRLLLALLRAALELQLCLRPPRTSALPPAPGRRRGAAAQPGAGGAAGRHQRLLHLLDPLLGGAAQAVGGDLSRGAGVTE